VMGTAVSVVTQSGLLPPSLESHFMTQNSDDLEVFVTQLVRLLLN
jgi:hypothetical protein